MNAPEDRSGHRTRWIGSPVGRISGAPQKPTCPVTSRRQLFANAAIAASRDDSKPCAAADVAYLSGLISFDNLRSG